MLENKDEILADVANISEQASYTDNNLEPDLSDSIDKIKNEEEVIEQEEVNTIDAADLILPEDDSIESLAETGSENSPVEEIEKIIPIDDDELDMLIQAIADRQKDKQLADVLNKKNSEQPITDNVDIEKRLEDLNLGEISLEQPKTRKIEDGEIEFV